MLNRFAKIQVTPEVIAKNKSDQLKIEKNETF